jgi:hypothetical protein
MIQRILLLILLLLGGIASLAGAEDDSSAAAAEPDAPAETAAIEAEDPELAEEIRAAEAAAATAPPLDPNESFIPTVQISEDLSVSFPLDI